MDRKDGGTKDKEKKGILSGIFRTGSLLRRGTPTPPRPDKEEPEETKRRKPKVTWDMRSEISASRKKTGRRRERRREPRRDKGKGRQGEPREGSVSPEIEPLTEWPPEGISVEGTMEPGEAKDLICRGATTFRGHKRPVPHASDEYHTLYATVHGSRAKDDDRAIPQDDMTTLMTLNLRKSGRREKPWDCLEQPSYAFYFGRLKGSITLNQWAAKASVLPASIGLRDSGVDPRDMSLRRILERLQELQAGLEDDDEALLYKILYKRILRDPDRLLRPHKTLDKQITDLILVLSRPGWIDFTNVRNHVATRFIFAYDEEGYRLFFHQLLLSLELEMRITSKQHDLSKRLLPQMPPTIAWSLALARRWRENVRVDDFGETPEKTRLRYKLKRRQVKQLRRFAELMKWPNLAETMDALSERDEECTLDEISSDAFTYFSGLVLPGPSFPFLIMNTLIDLDPDPATDDLALLSHNHPHCGFQYRNSYTYWNSMCIVGKVLAPTCRSMAGWVGPARPTPDLGRSQIARVRTRRPKRTNMMAMEDVMSMGERSDPLGPPADVYPVAEYELVHPDMSELVDTVRIERLNFDPAEETTSPLGTRLSTSLGPRLFDARVQFAIDGLSWPLKLAHDVDFVTAHPCSGGPHPLFFDYAFERIRVDEIINVHGWGGIGPDAPEGGSEIDDEKVLLVEAYGVNDNEILARAWCAHWGLSALIADVGKTCVGCAVREAYAGTLTVAVLVEGRWAEEEAEE